MGSRVLIWVLVGLVVTDTAAARRRRRRRARRHASRGSARKARAVRAPDVAWLVRDAEKAVDRGDLTKAVVLYRGAVALSGGDPKLLFRLGEIYRMSGQFAEATAAFERFLKVARDPARKAEAKSAIQAMKAMPAPFVDSEIRQDLRARSYGVKAFKLGVKAARRKRYEAAIRYFQAALMLDPSLVGVLRWIGQMYSTLKKPREAERYYLQYLRVMPAGPNADEVRKRLGRSPHLGTVDLTASFPCEVWINRAPLGRKKTPISGLSLPAGEYSVIFYNRKYHVGRKVRVVVRAGRKQKVHFAFGVLHVVLKPWARIRVDGRDVGLWDHIGVPARDRPYRVEFRSYDGSKHMVRFLTIRDGQVVTVDRWE